MTPSITAASKVTTIDTTDTTTRTLTTSPQNPRGPQKPASLKRDSNQASNLRINVDRIVDRINKLQDTIHKKIVKHTTEVNEREFDKGFFFNAGKVQKESIKEIELLVGLYEEMGREAKGGFDDEAQRLRGIVRELREPWGKDEEEFFKENPKLMEIPNTDDFGNPKYGLTIFFVIIVILYYVLRAQSWVVSFFTDLAYDPDPDVNGMWTSTDGVVSYVEGITQNFLTLAFTGVIGYFIIATAAKTSWTTFYWVVGVILLGLYFMFR